MENNDLFPPMMDIQKDHNSHPFWQNILKQPVNSDKDLLSVKN